VRILHVSRDYPPRSAGGLSTAVAALVDALERRGLECVVASFDDWRPSRPSAAGGNRPCLLADHPPADTGVVRIRHAADLARLACATRALTPDVVHVHDALLWGPARDALGQIRTRWVYTGHVVHAVQHRLRAAASTPPAASTVPAGVHAEAEAARQADARSAPGPAAAAELAAVMVAAGCEQPLPAVACTPPPLDPAFLAALSHGDTSPLALQAGARPRLATLGRFGDLKGTPTLVRALPPLLERHSEIDAVVAGGLPHNRRAERRWRRMLEQAHPRIRTSGWLDREQAARTLESAAIVVAPSRQETFGLAVLEAALAGAAVVASDIDAHREIDAELRRRGGACAGLSLFAVGDAEALVDRVSSLLDDREALDRRRRLAQAAALRMAEALAPAQAWLALYESVCTSPRRA
jgi:glycogen(starch) synthase